MSEFNDLNNLVQKYCECEAPTIEGNDWVCKRCGEYFPGSAYCYIDGTGTDINSPKNLQKRRREGIRPFNFSEPIWGSSTSQPTPTWSDPRPDWDTYFMSLAFIAAQRSLDADTKHGCILVGGDNSILSTGYNGPPRGCSDFLVPRKRPTKSIKEEIDKYTWMEHSERNAIANAARHGIALNGATCYVTGFPCNECYRMLVQSGIITIVYAPISLGQQYNSAHLSEAVGITGPTLKEFPKEKCLSVIHLLQNTVEYFLQRIELPTT